MKEWVTLADESKTVENLSTIEFDLANAELHDEFRLYVEVGKNANSDGEFHNLPITINGMSVGYYLFNTKWDANYNKYFEFEKLPKPRILTSVTSSVNVKYNTQNALIMTISEQKQETEKFSSNFQLITNIQALLKCSYMLDKE